MRQAAVIGASGHLGNNVCRALLEKGYEVRALVHLNRKSLDQLPLHQVQGNILDISTITSFLKKSDIVFHMAGKIAVDKDKDGSVRRVNVLGTKNVVEAALLSKVRRLIYVSSIHTLKQQPEELLDETRALVEEGLDHDMAKSDAEKEVLKGVERGLDSIILNPTAAIGPYDFNPSLLGKALIALCNKKIPTLVEGGFDWVDVRDIAKAAIMAVEKGRSGDRYIISGTWTSTRELAMLIEKVTGHPMPRFTSPNWLARIGLPIAKAYSLISNSPLPYTNEVLQVLMRCNRNISSLKAKEELGVYPRPLAQTIKDTFSWYKESGFISDPNQHDGVTLAKA